MYKINKEQMMTPELIKKIIEGHQQIYIPKFQKNDDYYHNKNQILQHINYRVDEEGNPIVDLTKPNNKVAHPYASYITDTLTGYFMGEGITYSSLDDDALSVLLLILKNNGAIDEDIELAKDMSIFGLGIELQYIDETGSIRFKRLDPREVVLVYDDTLEEQLLYAIRYFTRKDLLTNKETIAIEVYGTNSIVKYESVPGLSSFTFVGETAHYFGECPISVFVNNEEQIGDFEPVISLIDAYDSLESNSLNDFEYFVDAYLCLTGLHADSNDVLNMKANRILLLDEDSDAKWLIKDQNNTGVEEMKARLDEDIHKFSKVPNMSDENFSGNASGVAIKYKTLPMENIVSIKERKFKKGIQKRIELIFSIVGKKEGNYNWQDIEIIFTRNLPTNETEIASMASTLSGIVSNETLLAQIPFVEDVQTEQKRIELEKENNPFYDMRLGLNGEQEKQKEL